MQTAEPLLIHKFKLSNGAGDCRPFENSLSSTVNIVIYFTIGLLFSQTMPPYMCASDRNVLPHNVIVTDVLIFCLFFKLHLQSVHTTLFVWSNTDL